MLFTAVQRGRLKDKRHRLKQEIFRSAARRTSSSMRTAKLWNRLPREAARSSSLAVFEIALSDLA